VLSFEARVMTPRASRYLIQLCEHLKQIEHQAHPGWTHGKGSPMHAGEPPRARRVEWTDNHGIITFDDGQCVLDAAADALTVRLTADDAASLQRMMTLFKHRLETIGHRDKLVVTW